MLVPETTMQETAAASKRIPDQPTRKPCLPALRQLSNSGGTQPAPLAWDVSELVYSPVACRGRGIGRTQVDMFWATTTGSDALELGVT